MTGAKTGIGVDVDGVLAADAGRVIDLLNDTFGTDVAYAELDEYRYEVYWAARHPDIDREAVGRVLARIFGEPGFLDQSCPNLPMLAALKRLAGMSREPGGVTIVTARAEPLAPLTKRWLDAHGVSYQRILHTTDKVAACRAHGLKYMVEDAPHHATALAAAGIGVFLIDHPYNAGVAATGRNGIWRIARPADIPGLLAADLESRSR